MYLAHVHAVRENMDNIPLLEALITHGQIHLGAFEPVLFYSWFPYQTDVRIRALMHVKMKRRKDFELGCPCIYMCDVSSK